jgi:hypothetical protein
MNTDALMVAAAEANPISVTQIGMTPWETVGPTVDILIQKGWKFRQIFDWLRQHGIQIDAAQFRNFQVNTGRRKARLRNAAKHIPQPTTN